MGNHPASRSQTWLCTIATPLSGGAVLCPGHPLPTLASNYECLATTLAGYHRLAFVSLTLKHHFPQSS
jgi:hypothetical protein